ncbi:MAG: anhydro-N-acetylmuramic acid kinase, partial [Bacteroidota bacterium]
KWELLAVTSVAFPPLWRSRLRTAPHLPGRELWRLHTDLGKWMGKEARNFLETSQVAVELVGSHGHTVFHDPKLGFTTQIGDGACIAAATQLPTVDQLRSADLAAGGEGAPIAPLADRHLFPQYQAFLNLGGIANISLKLPNGDLIAGDVTGANQILDRLAQQLGRAYDANGDFAATGKFLPRLAAELGELPFHGLPCPKSLDNAWVVEQMWPIVEQYSATPQDKLHTICQFLASEISQLLLRCAQEHQLNSRALKVMVTGGGAHNAFLMDCLRKHPQDADYPLGFEIPDHQIADVKEAAMIALCALHRQIGVPNTIATATGASQDTINGALYLPPPQV